MDAELARLDAVGLAEAIRTGQLSPAEALESSIRRMESIDGDINAVIHRHLDEARASIDSLPDGPFRGVPMLMKDLWACEAGRPHHQGVQALKDYGAVADRDSHLVEAYREAGFVSFGRTNTPELGAGATTEPLAYGPTHNPWDLARGPGGSSGGAAAAVAAGVLPAANASDGGGSIRIPAAMCGLVGLKPSRGRISMGPHMDEWGNSVQHVVCHTVRDSASRIAARLEALGHHVEPSVPAPLLDESRITAWGPAFAAGTAASVAAIAAEVGRELDDGDIEPWTMFIAERASMFPPAAVIGAQKAMTTFRRDTATWWADGFDLLLTPTCLRPAPTLGEMAPDNNDLMGVQVTTLHYSQLTQPFNVTGQPAISLPLARSREGLPIGLQFVAPYAREDLLLSLAGQLESEYRWTDERAPLHP